MDAKDQVVPTRVVNLRHSRYDVLIARPSRWGNPFSHLEKSAAMYRVRTRDEAIARYAEWVVQQPDLMASLGELRGKVLGCYCHPLSCHGDVLARLADDLHEVPQLRLW